MIRRQLHSNCLFGYMFYYMMGDHMKKIIKYIKAVVDQVSKNHVGAYAAQSSYFFILTLIPIILLLLSIVQYTPLTQANVMEAVTMIFPEETMQKFISGIVEEVYSQSKTIIPITVLVVIWSAGKGVLSINYGLNLIYGIKETRNYFVLRVRASLYTVIFIATIVMGLVLAVFGNSLGIFLGKHFHVLHDTIEFVLHLKTVTTFCGSFVCSMLVYQYLPNKKNKITEQIPGAIFTALAWLAISFVFSIYLTVFRSFSGLYGSMTAIVLVMLWLYFCMYALLLGGILNVWLSEV